MHVGHGSRGIHTDAWKANGGDGGRGAWAMAFGGHGATVTCKEDMAARGSALMAMPALEG